MRSGIGLGMLALGCGITFAQSKHVLAEDVYRNIQIFKGQRADRVIPAMEALTGLLGVECSYCHIARDWDKEDKPQKQTARKMFEMMGYINDEHFRGENRISCWTCHRGRGTPPALPDIGKRTEVVKQLLAIPPSDESKSAELVFHDIRAMKGTPAGEFPGIMAYFSQSLGVECSHCHVPSHWDQDTPHKQTARTMLSMVDATVKKFYNGSGPLGCPDCHQGSVTPAFLPESPH